MNDDELLRIAVKAAISGAEKIIEIYSNEFEVEFKDDKSPLTLADRNAHDAISVELEPTGLPVLSEEGRNIPYAVRKDWNRFWLVDPLDGTKEFVKRNGEFTVNIALISNQKAVMGVILVPVTGVLYFASDSSGAFKTIVRSDKEPDIPELIKTAAPLPFHRGLKKMTVVGSRSHLSPETSKYINNLQKTNPDLDFVSIGSSLKMCLVAEGKASVYPRFGPTMEWDTGAGQAIVEIAGGTVLQAGSGKPVLYNKPELLNPWFVANCPV